MKILVVDDEELLLDLCEETLRVAGYEIATAKSGEEAIQRLNNAWDIIITDIAMKGDINGIEVLRRARATGSADVLIMTAYPELDTAIEAMREGAYDYLIKPFAIEALVLAVKRCVDKRQLSSDLAREKFLRSELEKAYFDLSQMEKVKETFGQFATREVVQFAMSHPEDFWRRGERKIVTVLFADVRRFTTFAGSVPPEQAVEALNAVFACIVDAVQQHGGIINKFVGDGVLALFGAPLPHRDHAQSAALAALQARDKVEEMAKLRNQRNLPPLRIGIGINTGKVVAGCLGTKHRMEYSVIGHAVNLSARLEKVAEAGQILLGPETTGLLHNQFELRNAGPLDLPNISGPVHLSELIGYKRAP